MKAAHAKRREHVRSRRAVRGGMVLAAVGALALLDLGPAGASPAVTAVPLAAATADCLTATTQAAVAGVATPAPADCTTDPSTTDPAATTTTTVPAATTTTTAPAATTTTTAPAATTTTTAPAATTTTTVPVTTTTTAPATTTTVPVTTTTTAPAATTTVPATTTTVPATATIPATTPTTSSTAKATFGQAPFPATTPTATTTTTPPAAKPARSTPAAAPRSSTTAKATGTSSTATSAVVASSTGYATPVPVALLTANPTWIGLDPAGGSTSPAGTPTPAAALALPVPAGTPVTAVTAGTVTTTAAADGIDTVVLTGTDGATYTTTGITAPKAPPATGATVAAGASLGTAAPGGITFTITVPDVAGPVCADDALQSWIAGEATDVRALPSTCVVGTFAAAAPTTHVLVVTDAGAGKLASDLAGQLTGTALSTSTLTIDDAAPAADQAKQIAAAETAPTAADLVVVALAHAAAGPAADLVGQLPADRPTLWVTPPAAADATTTAAERALVAAHTHLRIETPPAVLDTLTATTGAAPWSDVVSQVLSTLSVRYVTGAYRLPVASAQTSALLTYAEAQLGKPYVWAGAGPAVFDCSGLTMQAYAAAGVALPHNALAQYQLTAADAVPEDQLQPGDLVFFGPTIAGIHHVGIALGGGEFIDAPNSGSVVRFDHLGPGWDYIAATRPLGLTGSTATSSVGLSADQAFAQAMVGVTWTADQFAYLQELWQRESGWNPSSTNPTSGAYGIPQALPADKMASIGSDWATDAYTQILWGIGYIQARYGTPQAAWAHEVSAGWY